MSRRNFNPQSEQFNNRLITRYQDSFSSGMIEDIPASKLPSSAVRKLVNYKAYDNRLEPRAGSYKWSNIELPNVASGLTFSKGTISGTTYPVVGAAGTFASAAVGYLIVYDDGAAEEILTINEDSSIATVAESEDHASCVAGKIRAPLNGIAYHRALNKVVIHIGTEILVSDKTVTAWKKCFGRDGSVPANTHSTFSELKNSIVVHNLNGHLSVDLDRFGTEETSGVYTWHRMNQPVPSTKITAIPSTLSKKYGYRYIYTMVELSGSNPNRERTTTGINIIRESGTVQVSGQTDYSEIWLDKPIGAVTGTENTYKELNRSTALPADFNTIAEWRGITSGQFNITIDGTTHTIVVNFTGCTTWEHIAKKINDALATFFVNTTCTYDATTGTFVITNKTPGGSLGQPSAVGGGVTEIYSALTGTVSTLNLYEGALVRGLTLPDRGIGALFADHWTHYGVYRTADIGVNGIDPITGQGNNSQQFIWVCDLPIVKELDGTIVNNNDDTFTFTATTELLDAKDVGSFLIPSGTVLRASIESVTSSSVAILSSPMSPSPYGSAEVCAIGSKASTGLTRGTIKATCAYLSAGMVRITNTGSGYISNASDVGKIAVFHGATENIVVKITAISGEVIDGYCTSAAWTGILYGHILDGTTGDTYTTRNFTDYVTDDTLRSRIELYSCYSRTLLPFPDYDDSAYNTKSNLTNGAIVSGFLFSTHQGESTLYYNLIPSGYEYLAGYCNTYRQIIRFQDLINAIVDLNDLLVVMCNNSIHDISVNAYNDTNIDGTAVVVPILQISKVSSQDIGCMDWGSVRKLLSSQAVFRGSDTSIRIISYSSGGVQISDDTTKDRIHGRVSRMSGISAIAYDRFNGLVIWCKSNNEKFCYGQAMASEHGIGVHLRDGDDWVCPEAGSTAIIIYDTFGHAHTIVADRDGYLYDISGWHTETTGTRTATRKDKMTSSASGGTAILPSVLFPEDTGTYEHYFLLHEESHIGVRPADAALANESGYDSEGIPTDTEFDMTLYADGDVVNYQARSNNVNRGGDISFDRTIEAVAHRIQLELSANNAEHIIVSRQQYYKAADRAASPEKNVTTEMDHQDSIIASQSHLGWHENQLKDVTTGSASTASGISRITGPDDNPNAILTANSSGISMAVLAGGDFSFLITLSSFNASVSFEPGTVNISIVIEKEGSTYSAIYSDGVDTKTAPLLWDGTGWVTIGVVRTGTTLNIYEAS